MQPVTVCIIGTQILPFLCACLVKFGGGAYWNGDVAIEEPLSVAHRGANQASVQHFRSFPRVRQTGKYTYVTFPEFPNDGDAGGFSQTDSCTLVHLEVALARQIVRMLFAS